MVEENDQEYPVGYRKTPKHTQFKPGQSGNPKGRPRKSTTFGHGSIAPKIGST